MKIKNVSLGDLPDKHYTTEVKVKVEIEGYDYGFLVEISGYAPNASRREVDKGWEPDWGMDHVESETHLSLAETIVEAFKKL